MWRRSALRLPRRRSHVAASCLLVTDHQSKATPLRTRILCDQQSRMCPPRSSKQRVRSASLRSASWVVVAEEIRQPQHRVEDERSPMGWEPHGRNRRQEQLEPAS